MTYNFLCKFFHKKTAAWITAIWFAVLFMIMFALSSYNEQAFIYLDF
jgi:hypothetical protein